MPPDRLNEILTTASLFEDNFTVDWLMELTGFKAHQILGHLQEEVKTKLLTSTQPGIYAYRTSKQRHLWRNKMAAPDQHQLRPRIIELLMRDLPEDDDKWLRLSRHLLEVKNGVDGCRLLALAGDRYRKMFKSEEAIQCYSKVLEDLHDQSGEKADRLFTETAIQYSKLSTARHDTTWVLAMLHNALSRAAVWENLPAQALLEMHLAKNEWLRARYDQAMAHFEKGWLLAKDVDEPQLIQAVTNFGTFFLFWQGRFKEAVESYERSVSDVENYPKSRFPLLGAITAGYCYAQIGQFNQGVGMLDAIRDHCLEKGDLYLASNVLGNIGIIMLDMRKLADALSYLTQAVKLADETNNRWVWLSCQVALAFACHLQGETSKSRQHLEEFLKYSQETQATVQIFPYLLGLTWAMEQQQLPTIPGLSLAAEVTRVIASQNIFLRGLGRRYQALLRQSRGDDHGLISEALEDSIRWLSESGHQTELARSRIELANFFESSGERDKAQTLIQEANRALSFFDEALIPEDLRWLTQREKGSDRTLEEIFLLGQELVKIQNSHDLAQRIISTGNRVTGAERGAIFIWETNETDQPQLKLRASKNLTEEQINHPYFAPSMKMIEQVSRSGQGCIDGLESEGTGMPLSEGVIRSKISVPLTLYDRVVGVLYHDNRLLPKAFEENDQVVLSYIATLAAIALDNARAYDEISRLNQKLSYEKQYYEEEHLSHRHFDEIVGKSHEIKKVLAQIQQVADTEATVLITGETGVGKELVARAIQRHGARADRPFISVQLSTLPPDLMASELVGHEKGAFTGAVRRRVGRFELADGGTLFLDEIGDISLEVQIRLLRILQTKSFERIGGSQTLFSDFRLMAATNRDLTNEIRKGTFRADLYYRLNVFPIYVPPLRERREDIPLLAHHFLRIYSAKFGKNVTHIPDREMKKVLKYDWPGNVRELQNVIERGIILSHGPDFAMPELAAVSPAKAEQEEWSTLAAVEREHIRRILEKTDWKVWGPDGAAKILDLHPSTLAFRMKKLGITRRDRRKRTD